MAEKSLDIVAEKIERLDIRRNTSNQIISYTLPDDSEKLYGVLRIVGTRTAFPIADFNRVIYSRPSELVNPIPRFEINIVSKATIDTRSLITPRAIPPNKNVDSISLPVSPVSLQEELDATPPPVVALTPTSFGVTTRPTSPVVTTTPTPLIPPMSPIQIQLPNFLGLNPLGLTNGIMGLPSSNPLINFIKNRRRR